MPIRHRATASGQTSTRFDTRALYDLVRAVALEAKPNDPVNVTQRAWDQARARAGYSDAPSARCITMRLRATRNSRTFPWRELLELVFDPEANIDHVEVRRGSQQWSQHLTLRHVVFALRAVAKRLELASLTPNGYAAGREQILARRDRASAALLLELIPTKAQVELTVMREIEAVKNESQAWDRALELAGLEPRQTSGRKGQKGETGMRGVVPEPVAIHHYFEAGNSLDYWPSMERLTEFSVLADFRLKRQKSKRWHEILEEARLYRAKLGLPSPTKSLSRGRNAAAPVIGTPGCIPGAAPKRKAHANRPYTDAELWAALERYDREAPAGARTQTGYRNFATANAMPSGSLMHRIGGFRKAMNAVRAKRTGKDGK